MRPIHLVADSVGNVHRRGALETNGVCVGQAKVRVVPGNHWICDGSGQLSGVADSPRDDRIGKHSALWLGRRRKVNGGLPVLRKRSTGLLELPQLFGPEPDRYEGEQQEEGKQENETNS